MTSCPPESHLFDYANLSPLLLCVIAVVFSAVASLVPVSPAEPVLVALALVSPRWLLLPLLLLSTAGHMATKTLIFKGGGHVEKIFKGRHRPMFERTRDRLNGRPGVQRLTLFASSVFGIPPFYIVTVLCGTLKMPLREWLVIATAGRLIRFGILLYLPQYFKADVG